MAEEGKITMNEFKTVVEQFKDGQKKIVEVVNQRFDRQDERISGMMEQIAILHEGQTGMKAELKIAKEERTELKEGQASLKEQVSLLHEGQTDIKAELKTELKSRVTYVDFERLEKRVMRLENKVA